MDEQAVLKYVIVAQKVWQFMKRKGDTVSGPMGKNIQWNTKMKIYNFSGSWVDQKSLPKFEASLKKYWIHRKFLIKLVLFSMLLNKNESNDNLLCWWKAFAI